MPITQIITQRVNAPPTEDNTKRVASSGASVSVLSNNTWFGWGNSWANSWYNIQASSEAAPAIDFTQRISTAISGDVVTRIVKRVNTKRGSANLLISGDEQEGGTVLGLSGDMSSYEFILSGDMNELQQNHTKRVAA